MSDAEDSSRRLQRLAQILAESKVALASTTGRDADPGGFHLSSVPFERIGRLTSELGHRAAPDADDLDHLAMRLLLNDYTAAVAHLRATARLAEQRVAAAAVPIQETRRRIRLQAKHAAGATRKTI
jgi:hypothetical protein